jgi:hypothetical protein
MSYITFLESENLLNYKTLLELVVSENGIIDLKEHCK